MNKHSLNRFIDKYHLGGNCSSVVIKSDGNNLSTRFITGDKNLLGELKMSDWKFDKAELGVYNTEQLVKLLSVMSDNISMNLTKAGDKVVAFEDEAAIDTVLGVDIFPIVHVKTKEKIYVSLEDIKWKNG